MPDPFHAEGATSGSSTFFNLPQLKAALTNRRVAYWLWTLTLLATVGDLVTTMYGIQIGLVERNPVVAAALVEFGAIGLVGLKLFAFSWVLLIWAWLGRVYGMAALAGLFLPQAVAVGLNLLTISAV